MPVHFPAAEMSARKVRLLTEMSKLGLDGILLFAQESMYWLTGYDTFGFCFFQCLYLGHDGRTVLLTRSADLRQAEQTSNIHEIRIWIDRAGSNAARDLRVMLEDLKAAGSRLGVEYDSYGLTHFNGKRVEQALEGFVVLIDASRLVPQLRATKSQAELAFVRKAAALSDEADAAAIAVINPGVDEGVVLAAQHNAIFSAGGDYPANEFVIGSGADALLCRYKSGRRKLSPNDQITLEFAGVYRHYHAAIMRTHIVGSPKALHQSYHAAAKEALLACEKELRPGRTAGDIFDAHARVFGAKELSHYCLNACGYSLGAKFTPSWMDPPMFYKGNDFVIAVNQVYFAHMILMDNASQTAFCLGRTYIVNGLGAEPINAALLDLVVKSG